MNLNLKSSVLLFAIGSLVAFSSCQDDPVEVTPAKPVISNLEVGEGNSKEAEPGKELHLDAEIVAEGKIAKITVDLHPESGTGDDIEAEFTKYAGQKNADFHDHIEIPSTAEHGDYHFHLTVTDQEGQSTSVDADVHIH